MTLVLDLEAALSYQLALEHRLEHIKKHLEFGFNVTDDVANIEESKGNVAASAAFLGSHAHAMSILAWFQDRDLEKFRQWAYTSARLTRLSYSFAPPGAGPLGRVLELMSPLLSNDREIISWFASFHSGINAKFAENPAKPDFLALQAFLSLSGDWAKVRCRSELALSQSLDDGKLGGFHMDHLFFRALSTQDEASVSAALQKLVEPKSIKARLKYESGFTSGIISTFGVVYAKIATYSGCQVLLQTDYIPEAWISMQPAAIKQTPYRFLD